MMHALNDYGKQTM